MLRSKFFLFAGMFLGCILSLGGRNSAAQNFKLYVGNSRGDDISIVDMGSLKVTGEIKAGERVHGVCVQADGKRLFATVETDHSLRIIDTASHQTVATVKVSGRPNQCAATPDGKYVVVPIRDGDSVDIIDVKQEKIVEKKVLARVEIPAEHATLRKLEYESQDTLTHGLALTPDGGELWVSSLLDDAMYIYDVKAKKVTGKVNTGMGPNWIVFTPDGKYACVSNTDTDDVSVIDVKSRREVARVKVGKVPKRLAVAIAPTAPYRLR